MKPKVVRIELGGKENNNEVEFLTRIANEQLCQGRPFIFEGPLNLSRWNVKSLERFRGKNDNLQVITPCGINSKVRTRVISNNGIMIEKLKIGIKMKDCGLNFKRQPLSCCKHSIY